MAGYASGEGKLLEQFPHSLFVLLNARIKLGVCAFEVRVRHHAGAAVPRTANVNHVAIVLLDQAVEVHVDKVQSGRRPPVTEQPRLHVLKMHLSACSQRVPGRKLGTGAEVPLLLSFIFLIAGSIQSPTLRASFHNRITGSDRLCS